MSRSKLFSSNRILMWRNHGWSYKHVAKKIGCSLATVAAVIGRDRKLRTQKLQMAALWGYKPVFASHIPKHEDHFVF